jgi:hypothetical protein
MLDSLRTPARTLIRKCKQLAAVVLYEFIVGRLPFTLGAFLIKLTNIGQRYQGFYGKTHAYLWLLCVTGDTIKEIVYDKNRY